MSADWKPARIAIVCASRHHENTLRIAEAMSLALNADMLTIGAASTMELDRFDLVGFGSGIYFGRHDRSLLQLIDAQPNLPDSVFLFSTAGLPWLSQLWHWPLRRRLRQRGCRILGEFSCAGHDTVGPLAWIGGLNRGRPDAADRERARRSAAELLRKLSARPEVREATQCGSDR